MQVLGKIVEMLTIQNQMLPVCFVLFCFVLFEGQEEGKLAMEQADPLMLLIGLPSIPVMLVLGKLVRWEDQILKLWRSNHHKIPFLDYIIGTPSEKARDSTERVLLGRDNFSDPTSATRMFCGALLLPTVSTLVGKSLFNSVESNLHRAILVND